LYIPQNFNPVLPVNGTAVFVEDATLKKRALDENPPIQGMYRTPDNPIFKIFRNYPLTYNSSKRPIGKPPRHLAGIRE
jgi:uncharacterized pyridoxamine 5'-phosphate oxidase family protein